ncbi:MAG: RimK family alpha-L-glutamate ligase [Promethearchaeota archaeon]
MLIGITVNRITWEVKQIINELEKKSIKYKVLNNQKLYFKLSNSKDLDDNYTVILERSLSYFRGLYICSILETKGYDVINNFTCLNITGNKLLTTLNLLKEGVPTPLTCIAFKEESALDAIDNIMNYPVVIKPLIGSWGRLIAKLDDYNCARANLECREIMGNVLQKIYYLQKYLPINKNMPTDLRVFVIGDQCIAAMGRYSAEKDFRSNIAIGGTAKPIDINSDLEKICLKASKAVKGEIVGVDLMYDNDELKVIEVNGTPQFKGISTATNINVAGEIVNYILEKYS